MDRGFLADAVERRLHQPVRNVELSFIDACHCHPLGLPEYQSIRAPLAAGSSTRTLQDRSSDEVRTVASRLNGPRLPGFDDFSRTVFDFGLDTAVALYEEALATDPEHRMFNAWSLNRIIAEFSARGDYEAAEACVALALNAGNREATLLKALLPEREARP